MNIGQADQFEALLDDVLKLLNDPEGRHLIRKLYAEKSQKTLLFHYSKAYPELVDELNLIFIHMPSLLRRRQQGNKTAHNHIREIKRQVCWLIIKLQDKPALAEKFWELCHSLAEVLNLDELNMLYRHLLAEIALFYGFKTAGDSPDFVSDISGNIHLSVFRKKAGVRIIRIDSNAPTAETAIFLIDSRRQAEFDPSLPDSLRHLDTEYRTFRNKIRRFCRPSIGMFAVINGNFCHPSTGVPHAYLQAQIVQALEKAKAMYTS